MTAEQLSQLLDELGKRLGPAGQHVFELAVRQQYIDGITSLAVHLGLLIGACALAWLGWLAHRNTVNNDPNYREGRDLTVGQILMGIAIFGACFVVVDFCVSMQTITGKLLNPEYAALRDILSTVKP